jgi:hypothetical protein
MAPLRWSSIGKAVIERLPGRQSGKLSFVLGFIVTFDRQRNQMAVNSSKSCD